MAITETRSKPPLLNRTDKLLAFSNLAELGLQYAWGASLRSDLSDACKGAATYLGFAARGCNYFLKQRLVVQLPLAEKSAIVRYAASPMAAAATQGAALACSMLQDGNSAWVGWGLCQITPLASAAAVTHSSLPKLKRSLATLPSRPSEALQASAVHLFNLTCEAGHALSALGSRNGGEWLAQDLFFETKKMGGAQFLHGFSNPVLKIAGDSVKRQASLEGYLKNLDSAIETFETAVSAPASSAEKMINAAIEAVKTVSLDASSTGIWREDLPAAHQKRDEALERINKNWQRLDQKITQIVDSFSQDSRGYDQDPTNTYDNKTFSFPMLFEKLKSAQKELDNFYLNSNSTRLEEMAKTLQDALILKIAEDSVKRQASLEGYLKNLDSAIETFETVVSAPASSAEKMISAAIEAVKTVSLDASSTGIWREDLPAAHQKRDEALERIRNNWQRLDQKITQTVKSFSQDPREYYQDPNNTYGSETFSFPMLFEKLESAKKELDNFCLNSNSKQRLERAKTLQDALKQKVPSDSSTFSQMVQEIQSTVETTEQKIDQSCTSEKEYLQQLQREGKTLQQTRIADRIEKAALSCLNKCIPKPWMQTADLEKMYPMAKKTLSAKQTFEFNESEFSQKGCSYVKSLFRRFAPYLHSDQKDLNSDRTKYNALLVRVTDARDILCPRPQQEER